MASIGGDITEITCNHPTLGNFVFYPKSGEDSTFDPGGVRSNDDANQIAGNGENIVQMNRQRWSLETTVAGDMNTRKDLLNLRSLAGNPTDGTWTISHINGTVHKGKGRPVGDIQQNGNAATIALKLAGGGIMEQIV